MNVGSIEFRTRRDAESWHFDGTLNFVTCPRAPIGRSASHQTVTGAMSNRELRLPFGGGAHSLRLAQSLLQRERLAVVLEQHRAVLARLQHQHCGGAGGGGGHRGGDGRVAGQRYIELHGSRPDIAPLALSWCISQETSTPVPDRVSLNTIS